VITPRRPLDGVRELWRAVRNAPERVLHPWRRARARALLRRVAPPDTVLVICHANLCRSPYAAGALRRLLPPTAVTRVESAGFRGAHRSPPRDALEVAAARGVSLGRHTSRLLTPAAVMGADLVVVMEPGQAGAVRRMGRTKHPVLVLGDLDPLAASSRSIRDPVEQPRQIFAESYGRIDRCLGELVAEVWGVGREAGAGG